MTEPETPSPLPVSEQPGEATAQATETTAAEAETAPPPEPWTPERVSEWNSYYDLYIAIGLLLLIFVTSANKITHPTIWTQLRVGQVMSEDGAPLVKDLFSFSKYGQPWVNIPWLFEWGAYLFYKLFYGLYPRDPNDMAASASKAEQLGAGALVALHAVIRVITALILLRIRRPGPGLWWNALCITFALGAVMSPVGVVLGGIAAPGQVSPGTWGILLLAIELLLLYRAIDQGRQGALFALIPLFLVWANVDESFLIGLVILAAATIGLLDRPAATAGARTAGKPGGSESELADGGQTAASGPPGFVKGLGILAVCAAICLLNPSFYKIYGSGAALAPFASIFAPKGDVRTIDQVSFFGREIQERTNNEWVYMTGYYLITTAIGLGTFILNLRRFSLSRFLMYAAAAALWAFMIRYGAEFALVFAATVTLNGQEWYQGRFGTSGRLGRGWAAWSVGGRAVSIILLFFCTAKALTGWGTAPFLGELMQFGFGFNPDNFEFEAAEYLKDSPIKGNILNTTRHQGDSIAWKAYPQRKSFIDNRHNLFDAELLKEWLDIRNALKTDDVDTWKPKLDKYEVSAIMLDPSAAENTYKRLMQSINWIPFYDDGNVVMFGRADASPENLAYFKERRLDADTLVYRRFKPVPPVERPPTQVTWIDEIFQSRTSARTQPHTAAAGRWLQGLNFEPTTATIPDPAHCYMVIREARTALASRPDDHLAYRILFDAYRILMLQESALLQGVKLTPENSNLISQLQPQTFSLLNRYRQQVTALNFAIQTTPPPQDRLDREQLTGLQLQMFTLYMSVNHLDLARDRLQLILDKMGPNDYTPEFRAGLKDQFAKLNDRVKQIEDALSDMALEQNAGPVEKAFQAIQMGAPGIAIHELEEADRTNLQPRIVKPQLLDLYCDTGQPDKALEMLTEGNTDDASLGTEPGTAAMRKARVYAQLGNYDVAAALWEGPAIQQLRFDRSFRSILQLQSILRGEVKPGMSMLLDIPKKVATQASWEFELGICRLESGVPDASPEHPEGAASHFTKALTLSPDLSTRPIIAYYLEMLGKTVPPTSAEKEKEQNKQKAKSATDQAAKDKGADEAKAKSAEANDKASDAQAKPAANGKDASKPDGARPAEPKESAKEKSTEAQEKPKDAPGAKK